MEIIKIKVEDLKPYKNNAKLHPEWQIEQIIKSIEQFGFNDPIAIWGEDNIIVEGHGRLEAVKKLGYTEVECIRLDHLTEEERKAYTLAHNKTTMNSDFDFDLLKLELDDIKGIDMSDFGFELDLDDKEVKDDEFDLTAALEKASFVERGDVWFVGKHKLMCGDATSSEDVAKLMEDKKANLILTDPPYNVAFKSSDGLTIQNDSMKNNDFYEFLFSSFKNMAEHLENGGAAYIFHADTEGLNFRKAFIDAGFHLAGCCIWVKDSLVLGRSDYQWQHEPVLYGFMQNGKHPWYSDRKQTTIWNFDKPKKNSNHPTSKPLDLLAYPINNSTQANAIVIDTFGGSGSTLMACEQMNRICYTMELDEKYASVILRRYVEDTNDSENVYVIRNGEKILYKDLVKEVEVNNG